MSCCLVRVRVSTVAASRILSTLRECPGRRHRHISGPLYCSALPHLLNGSAVGHATVGPDPVHSSLQYVTGIVVGNAESSCCVPLEMWLDCSCILGLLTITLCFGCWQCTLLFAWTRSRVERPRCWPRGACAAALILSSAGQHLPCLRLSERIAVDQQ